MAKPPPSGPHTDIEGADRDRIQPGAPERWDDKAQRQLEAENRDSPGRPDQGHGSPAPSRHADNRFEETKK